MLKYILPNIPKHHIYVEPFLGGGAVFWAKEPCKNEILNDTNKEVINFCEVAQNDFKALNMEIQATLHSRAIHKQARVIYTNPEMFTPVKRAWAFWTLANQSFCSDLDAGWKYARNYKIERVQEQKRKRFTKEIQKRLRRGQLECRDAIQVIKRYDSKRTFFYLDPPYFNADQGHYKGYTIENFTELLETLANIKGKFILSSYPSKVLNKYISKYKWTSFIVEKKITVAKYLTKSKQEVVTGNYWIFREK